ncbi:hypothetical protein PM082_023231 [Marasmius tenuissimus]|nr:hypothetical protein PM082_023231 [Marasmius tenuissimus]
MPVENRNEGSGTQNNHNTINQNANYGRDQIVNFNASSPNPHKTLWDAVAGIGASHAAEQQYERGKCLEGTRVELREIIHEWGEARGQESPLFLLFGAAGVGKTAIAMSIAEACEQKDLLVSSFFFFRSEPKRNNPQALVLTIAHGLISTMSFMRPLIEQRISADPRVFEATLEVQFRELILNPIMLLGRNRRKSARASLLQALCLILSSVVLLDVIWGLLAFLCPIVPAPARVPDIVIVDGLDECSDEHAQLRILEIFRDAVRQAPHFPLRFLICSRPEAWITQALDSEHFRGLSKVIRVDDAFEDSIKYCHHHFQKIVNDPKYRHVRFPDPWPSKKDFGTLIDRSCSQFVYVATIFRHLTLEGNHPVNKLRLILDSSPNNQPSASPYPQLDALYHTILESSPNTEEVHSILIAILVLSDYLKPSPAHIELLLGLSSGQVDLALRRMHSVLEIHGPAVVIRIRHTSFREYLADQNRSQRFYIDEHAQKHFIAQQWLSQLTTTKIQDYSLEQLYSEETASFFTEWIPFCTSISKPKRRLFEHLLNVDLASAFLCCEYSKEVNTGRIGPRWRETSQECHSWAQRLCSFNDTAREDHKVGHDSDISEEWDCVDLAERLRVKFVGSPKSFHLECFGVGVEEAIVLYVVALTTQCRWRLLLTKSASSHQSRPPLRLTDCSCDLTSRRQQADDPKHVTYQEACLQLLKANISEFQEVSHGPVMILARFAPTNDHLNGIFRNVVNSLLLQHCHLDTELLSLCRTFLDSAKRCSKLKRAVTSDVVMTIHDTKLLEWIETFPVDFSESEEAEALRAQVLAFPWNRWSKRD